MENISEDMQEIRKRLFQLPLIENTGQDFFRPVTLANVHSKEFIGVCYVAGRTKDEKVLLGTYTQPKNTLLKNEDTRSIPFGSLCRYHACGM